MNVLYTVGEKSNQNTLTITKLIRHQMHFASKTYTNAIILTVKEV